MESFSPFTKRAAATSRPDQARFYLSRVGVTINRLHECEVIYRDLNPENTLCSATGHTKLAGFGLARLYQQADVVKNGATMWHT